MTRRWESLAAIGTLTLLTACSGGGSLPAGRQPAPGANVPDATVSLHVRIPRRHGARNARWISPSTKSMSIAFAPNGSGKAATGDFDLTSTSDGCTTVAGTTSCALAMDVAPGAYLVTVSTFSALGESGSELSHGDALPATVTAGKANTVSLTIGGVPHSFAVSGVEAAVHGTQAAGFTLYGSSAQHVIVTAKDAQGNTIVGTGTPYAASVLSGSGWSIASAGGSTPNEFAVTPPGTNNASASMKIALDYTDGTCSLTGVVCSATFAIKNDVQLLAMVDCETSCGFSANPDAVKIFKLPNVTTPIATVTNGVLDPLTVALDSNENLYVANCRVGCGGTGSDTVTVYAPPYTGTPVTVSNGVNAPTLLAVDPSGDLFVNDCITCNFGSQDYVTEYPHGNLTTATPATLLGTIKTLAIAADSSGNLLMATCQVQCMSFTPPDAIVEYSPPSYSSATTITNGAHFYDYGSFAFDSAGNLYSTNCADCSTVPVYTIAKYAPPYSSGSNPALTISSGLNTPVGLALDSHGNVFVGNAPGTNAYVSEYEAPSFSGSGTQLFGGAAYQALELQIDGFDDIIMTDTDDVRMATPPYPASLPSPFITEGLPSGYVPFAISP